jgi:uncharacterized protein
MVPRSLSLKVALVLLFASAPVIFLVSVGSYHLYTTGWSFIAYWPMALCWLLAFGLGWFWTRQLRQKVKPQEQPEVPTPNYWTARDHQAWELVQKHAEGVEAVRPDQMSDLNRYATDAQALALKVAQIYQPGATDPFAHLTMPEILTCGELVAHDLSALVISYVPGSHLMTIQDIKRVRQAVDTATDWYPRIRNLYWAVSLVMNPLKAGMQIAASKAGLGPAYQGLQQNLLLWFHTAYIREIGRYLIELNSGRLKVGAKRYLELMAQHQAPPEGAATPSGPEAEAKPVTAEKPIVLAVVGPVKAGKSTLVNVLLGEQLAATDVLPLTQGKNRYTLSQPGRPTFILIDTQGFGQTGATDSDVKAAIEAAQEADLMLVVVPARSAARKPEVDFLDQVRAGIRATPQFKLPPTLVALSHIDLLTPAMEWAPPYDWRSGMRTKEVQMREAVLAAAEVFGDRAEEFIPVCTAKGKEQSVREELLAALAVRLGQARGVALLRALHAESSTGQTRKVFDQLANVSGQIVKTIWKEAMK